MFRISVADDNGARVVLNLEGALRSDWVEELVRECARWDAANRMIILNLRDVRFVDFAAAGALKALEARGVELVECTAFVRALLRDCC